MSNKNNEERNFIPSSELADVSPAPERADTGPSVPPARAAKSLLAPTVFHDQATAMLENVKGLHEEEQEEKTSRGELVDLNG